MRYYSIETSLLAAQYEETQKTVFEERIKQQAKMWSFVHSQERC